MKSMRRWFPGLASLLGTAFLGLCGCQTYYGGMTLPTGRYLQQYPQYFAPDPVHPLPRELADMEDPEGAARRAGLGGGGIAPLGPPAGPVPVGGGQ